MGAFDDLVPTQGGTAVADEPFADLIPKKLTPDELRAEEGGEAGPIPKSPEELAMRNWRIGGGAIRAPEPTEITLPGGTKLQRSNDQARLEIPRIVAPPEAGVGEKVAAGTANVVGGVANFAISPEGIALAIGSAAAPEVFGGPLVKGLFSGLMAKSAGQQLGQALPYATRAGIPKPQRVDPQAITEATESAAMVPLILKAGGILPRAATEAKTSLLKGIQDARSQQKAAEVHGDVRSLTTKGQGQVPVEEGGPGVQPQPQTQAPEGGQARVLVNNRPALKLMPDEEAGNRVEIVPAERKPDGTWETHDEIIARYKLKTGDIDRRIFLDPQGNEKSREQVAPEVNAVGIATKVPGEAHASDVNKAAAPALPPLEPVAEGMVRLYTGKGGATGAGQGGSWFSPNPDRAASFGPDVHSVDVPKDVADRAQAQAKLSGSGTKGDAVLPDEWVRKAKPVEGIQQKAHDLGEIEGDRAKDLLDMSPSEFVTWKQQAGYGPEKMQAMASTVTSEDLSKLTAKRDELRAEVMASLKGATPKTVAAIWKEQASKQALAQTLNEMVEHAPKAALVSDLFPDLEGKAPTLERVRRAITQAEFDYQHAYQLTYDPAVRSDDPIHDKVAALDRHLKRLRALGAKMEASELEKAKSTAGPKPLSEFDQANLGRLQLKYDQKRRMSVAERQQLRSLKDRQAAQQPGPAAPAAPVAAPTAALREPVRAPTQGDALRTQIAALEAAIQKDKDNPRLTQLQVQRIVKRDQYKTRLEKLEKAAAQPGAGPTPGVPEFRWSEPGAYRAVPEGMADKPDSLGKFLTEKPGRRSSQSNVRDVRARAVLQDPNGGVHVLSTFYDSRISGAMLADPEGGKAYRPLTELLKQGYEVLGRTDAPEPQVGFRFKFKDQDEFKKALAQVGPKTVGEAPAIGQEGGKLVPITQSSVEPASAEPVLNHMRQFPDINAAAAAISKSPNRNRIRAAIKSEAELLIEQNPQLTDAQALRQATETLYAQSKTPTAASKPKQAVPAGAGAVAQGRRAAPPQVQAGPVAAPKAAVGGGGQKPPSGVRLDVTTPGDHPLGPIDPATPRTLAWHQILSGELKEAGAGLTRFWRAFANQSLPKITEADRATGEAGARFDASKRVARMKGLEFAGHVTDGIKVKDFDLKLGTALNEENLRDIRQGFAKQGAAAAGKGDAETAQAASDAGAKVTTLIGAKNSPFKTEAEYQDFLKSEDAQTAIKRHIQLWKEQKDPIFRKANDLDPDLPLETRGLQTGARINLKAILEGEGSQTTVGQRGRSTLIRQAVTRLRKDPFARQAKGTGESYEGSYNEIMAHGYEREYPVAAQHDFIKQMLDSGIAKVTPDEFPKDLMLRGEAVKAYELKLRPWRNQWLQVPRSLAHEYENVSGLTPAWNIPVVKSISDFLTQASVQGFAEGSTHVSNLSTQIFTGLGPTANPLVNVLIKVGSGRADLLWQIPRTIIRGFENNRAEILKLAEINAAKEPYGGMVGWLINGIDKGVRLVSSDTYKGMAKGGWVVDTETGLREYVNQTGQYSKRLQPMLIARLRETGVQPFATAVHTWNVQGLRTLGMGPGAKAPTKLAALALRADKAAGLMGFIVLWAAINKLVSGKVAGPPGTQLGSIGWIDEKDKKLHQFNLARVFGYERGPRITGLQAFAEARRMGLPEGSALAAGARSIGQTGLSYLSGPATQFATKALTGKRPGVPMVQESKVMPPQAQDPMKFIKTQAASNIATALQQANPAIDASIMAIQGKEIPDILQRQFSRYTPRTGMSQETIEALPKIVHAGEMQNYVDALAKEARKKPLMQRAAFINQKLKDDEVTGPDFADAMRRLKIKGVYRYR